MRKTAITALRGKAAICVAVLLSALVCCAAQARAAQTAPAPDLPVTGASLLVAGTDTPLWSLDGDSELPIASTTKLMTALVVLQHVEDLNTVFTQNDWDASAADSQIGLQPGERMTVHDLLVALLLPSADDAAEDLAYNVGGGSVARFVAMMNADARTLGLDHTHYSTPIGLDTPGNYSSPDDLVRLGDYMMRNWPFFQQTVALSTATLQSGNYVRHVTSTDDLLAKVEWIDGIKTGHTSKAGYVLVSQGTRDGFTLIASVLGTPSEAARDASALSLLQWGFSQFHLVTVVRAGKTIVAPKVPYEDAPARIVAARGYRAVLARNARVQVRRGRLRKLTPPMAKGAVVGRLSVVVAGRATVTIPLVLAHRLPPVSSWKKFGHFITRPITLLVLVLLLGGAVAGATMAARRRRPRVLAAGPLEER